MVPATQAVLRSGDSLLVSVALERPIAAERLNWDASYTGVEGGLGATVQPGRRKRLGALCADAGTARYSDLYGRYGRLGDWLEANSRLTVAEAYRGEETRPVQLSFVQPVGGERPRALQNYLNPFAGQMQVPFWLPVEGQVWLRVYDLTGRLVLERSGMFPRGSHRFELKAEELGTGNAWFYQVGGADWVESRQMTRF